MNLARGLRGRLLLVTVVVLTAGMAAAGGTAFLLLDRHLAQRRDQVLAQVLRRLDVEASVSTRDPFPEALVREVVPPGVYLGMYDTRDTLVLQELPPRVGAAAAASLPAPAALARPSTVRLGHGSPALRVQGKVFGPGQRAAVLAGGTSREVGAVVIGVSLADDEDTLARLRQVLLVVSAVGLALLLVGAHLALTIGLAPLRHLADIAHDVARGRTWQRARVGDPRTETGQVALALNAAFDASERNAAVVRRFVDDASHELRTPLATIVGWADLYASGGLREWDDVDTVLGHVHTESTRMAALVDAMLTLARLDARQPMAHQDVDLGRLCREVVEGARITHAGRSVGLVAAPGHTVRGDPAGLRRVVANLVDNALRHTDTDVCVEVATQGQAVKVVVADEGPGLSPEQRQHAFDRFWRVPPDSATPGGSGLGLAIARDLARAHGGELSLHPGPLGGTRAVLDLPAAARAPRHPAHPGGDVPDATP